MIKKLLVVGSFSIAVVFSSCVKKYCYDCTTQRTEILLPENTVTGTKTNTVVHCDQTSESIKEVEKNGTKHTTFTKDGKTYQEQMVTTCVPY